jgi:hypothetical protein
MKRCVEGERGQKWRQRLRQSGFVVDQTQEKKKRRSGKWRRRRAASWCCIRCSSFVAFFFFLFAHHFMCHEAPSSNPHTATGKQIGHRFQKQTGAMLLRYQRQEQTGAE